MLFPIDAFFIIGILFFLFGGIKIIADSIGTIVMAMVIIALLYWGLTKKPEIVVVIVVIHILLIIGVIIWNSMSDTIYAVKEGVTLYDTVGENVFTDNDNVRHEIPLSSVVAKYRGVCYWYCAGKEYSAQMGNSNDDIWNLKEIKKISYRDFVNNDWWILAWKK